MTETDTGPNAADNEDESNVAHPVPGGDGGDTIELVFSDMEFNEFLNDPGMHGDLSDWLAQTADPATPVSPLSMGAPQTQTSALDDLLISLGDDMLLGEGQDVLEAASRLSQPTEDDRTFLLTEIDIGDLIGDHEQAWDATALGLETEFLTPSFVPPVTLHFDGPGPIIFVIEDELDLTAAHILS